MRELTIVALLASLIFVSGRLVHVENQRYALILGLCKFDTKNPGAFQECLERVRIRDSALWHLYYGLTD